jgi:hypothetical protein
MRKIYKNGPRFIDPIEPGVKDWHTKGYEVEQYTCGHDAHSWVDMCGDRSKAYRQMALAEASHLYIEQNYEVDCFYPIEKISVFEIIREKGDRYEPISKDIVFAFHQMVSDKVFLIKLENRTYC